MATANITTHKNANIPGGIETVLAELDATISILSRQPEADTVATSAMIHASTARAVLRDVIQGHSVDEPVVIQNMIGIKVSTSDVRAIINQVANAYPELRGAMEAASHLIVHLETLRHEALLPLSLGRLDDVKYYLKQRVMVEVSHV